MKWRIQTATLIVVAVVMAMMAPAGLCAQERAPDIVLSDLLGKTFKLRDYRDKTVLLVFGATWCPACRTEIPHFKQIYTTYAPRGLEMLYVNIQETRDKVARFVEKNQLPYRTLLDIRGDVANAYGIMGVPAMVLIRDGKILTRNYRLIDGYLERIFPR